MPCYFPVQAWRSKHVNASGKRGLVFKERDAYDQLPALEVPCGRCIGCKLEYSRQWAIRCVNEASLYEENCVITLTYNETHLPKDGSLNKKHFQDFVKRLRSRFPDRSIRYFQCGEYGDDNGRPHYHACIFNFDFPDKKFWNKSAKGDRLCTSEVLASLWPYGYSLVGTLSFESAAYIARYITKKITGPKAEGHYQGKQPEYLTMSRRPGIAREWFEKYKKDVYPSDFMIVNGKKVGVPKYYDQLLSDKELRSIKKKRKYKQYELKENSTLSRLQVREMVHSKRAELLKRSFEDD